MINRCTPLVLAVKPLLLYSVCYRAFIKNQMINVSDLKKGNIVKILVDNEGMGLKAGDTLRVVETGRSRWDAMDYADCKTDKGYTVEIMKNYADFELVC
jgi:hypothetical protein